ncbi:hypothetical protein T484DRAFT_1613856, partial [Baffinella frigidus]
PRPSTLNPRPSTLGPQPSTLGPQPSTLGPQPSTLGPQPSTLGPQPSTLGPQPSTLGPQPSTLGPQPSSTPSAGLQSSRAESSTAARAAPRGPRHCTHGLTGCCTRLLLLLLLLYIILYYIYIICNGVVWATRGSYRSLKNTAYTLSLSPRVIHKKMTRVCHLFVYHSQA